MNKNGVQHCSVPLYSGQQFFTFRQSILWPNNDSQNGLTPLLLIWGDLAYRHEDQHHSTNITNCTLLVRTDPSPFSHAGD